MSDTTHAAVPDLLAVSKAYVQLPAEKRRQFRHQLRARGMQASRLPIVPFPNRGAMFPLSHAQERMWFLWKLDPASAAYNITGAVRLQGTLDQRAVRAALDRLVARHESLRKHFIERDGVPMQVTGSANYAWRERVCPDDMQAALDALSNEAFDLEHGPLLRVTLLQSAPDDHVLHIAIHHIVSDGLSMSVFVDEFVSAYRAELGVAPSTHGPGDEPIQYGDFAAWQREWLDDESLAGQLAYWRGELGGEQPVLELPFDRVRTGMRHSAGASVARTVDARTAAALRRVSQSADATLFTTLLSAYQVLLSRYGGQDDIRVGVPVSGRDRDETERVIGFFVNTLVLRARMDEASTFMQLLTQMRARTLAAYAHQDVPFSRLVQELQPQRSFGHTPLFQTMFNYLGAQGGPIELPGLTVADISSEMQTARFDLVLNARERGDGLEVSFTYARDVFDEATIARMLDHYVSLLSQIAVDGHVHLGALTLDAAASAPALAEHAFAPVGARVAEQRIGNAVHCEGVRLSYAELQAWSARIAHALIARGVQAETRVGLCLTRSPALIAALVGVLRSGGAFVPLDPAYPAERLQTMLDDARVQCVIADADTLGQCGALFEGIDVIDVNGVGMLADTAPDVSIHPEQLAYVIYTSGSTGKPKGVAVSHVSLSRHLDDFIGCYGITSDDTQLQSSTINFDVALHEMLPALMQGGQVEMRGPQLWDIDTTSRHLRDARVTFSRIPTAYWQQWLRTPPPAHELAALRQITVGGEGLPGDALAQWRRGPLAHIRLDNLYGPTETTVACLYRQTNEADTRQSIVSIGEPYASRCVQVLDRFGNEAPVGGLGELCIGGLTLARGYLGRADITAERFVPDPRTPGARMYRSGDLCRRRADGGIDFLGRLDQQVKLRGFRIELGEIEAALRQIEGVSAAIVALTGEGESRQLVGYVVGQDDVRLLRRTLEARLPSYMVPSSFVALDALPLMPNGKVDRAALPAPEAPSHQEHVSARTPLEAELLSIWQSVLNRADIGVTENFFEAGGHSLLLMQVASRIRQEMGREVSLATLFMHPVLESLAAELEASERQTVERIRARAKDSRIPLTHAQERLWFLWNLEPQSAAYTIAGAVRLKGKLNKAAVRTALDTLVTRHESLRTRFVEEDAQTWQVVDEQPRYGWHEAAYEGETQLHALSHAPLDLRQGPMLKVALLAVNEQEAVLHFAMPHIVSDAWSQGILLREFSNAYAAALGHEVTPPEALPIQYGDYAAWQREHTSDATLEAQYAYWQATLGKEHPVLELPVDRVRRGPRTSAGATLERCLDPTLSQALDTLSQTQGVTRFMTMLAAFGLLLGRCSGQRDIRIGVPEAGRDRLETEPLIGFFVNTLVIRMEARGTQPFEALLAEVRQHVLDAQSNASVPFARLVERLQPQRTTSHTPLFQVLFNYSEQTAAELNLPGVQITPLSSTTNSAQFDLSMEVTGDHALTLGLNYATDIFDASTIHRLLDDYVTVLEHIVRDAGIRATQIELDRTADAQANARPLIDYTFTPTPALIAMQAASTPDAIAVRCGDESTTYAKLDAWANRIAAHLHASGVRREARVGICTARSAGMVAALIGVMRSGAAYVPIDPALPAERIAYMLDDAGVACLIADDTTARSFDGVVARVIRLAQTTDAPSHDAGVFANIHASQLAYVIYTSGSTGKPKGVGISHDALARFLASMRVRPGIDADDVMLSVTTLSFDIAALELYLPLVSGARIELARREDVTDGERLAALLARSGATMMQATPMGWNVLLEGGWQGTSGARATFKALCGGEALPAELASRLQARGVELWNMYGPTETTIWSSIAQLNESRATLGEPIEGTTFHLIDADGASVPKGGIGELCIGGTNLARGYLGRAALTAERFVPDPFTHGARLYRTGDLCRIEGGRLAYVGRADHQVKLRGFRIELGEIEASLRRLEGVRDAAAAVKEVAGQPMLVAYLVTVGGIDAETAGWQAELARHLPPYMVPQRFIPLDALPRTHNDKLDRNALPVPRHETDDAIKDAPRTAAELAIANIWQSVLGVDAVSANDDFFLLGGESLRALRMIAAIRTAFDIDLPVQAVFAHPVLSALASVVDGVRDSTRGPRSIAVHEDRRAPAPLSFEQERLYFFSRLDPESAAYNLSGAVRMEGALDRDAVRAAITALVTRHESMRTTFVEGDEGPVQIASLIAEPAWSVLDFADVPEAVREERLDAALRAIARAPFSLERGPLLRVTLLRLATNEHVLQFVVHHIVSDAWSVQIMIDEFAREYSNARGGRSAALPALPIQYADYARWQRDPHASARLDDDLAYWRMRLAGDEPLLALPFDRSPQGTRSQDGARVSIALEASVQRAVTAVAQRHRTTPFVVLLAVFDVLLARYSGSDDVRIGVPVAGREHGDTQALIGFFVNTLVIRSELATLRNVDELMAHVRERVLEAQAHQAVPFSRVVDALSPGRSLAQTPLFNVMFNFEPALGREAFAMPGLRVSPMESGTGTARFDLVLNARERGDGLEVSFTYARDVFDEATIARMLDHYVSLLSQIAVDGHVHLGALTLDAAASAPALAEHAFAPVGARVAEQRIGNAVHCEGVRLSYAELQAWSARIAHALIARGVQAETRVGLCLTRSPALIAALVGVLRSGGAFVPLDPAYPAERLQTMLDDARVQCVIADADTLGQCGALFEGIDVIDVNGVGMLADTAPDVSIHPEQLAYVIYTSGSTGKPKGVAVSHVSLSRHLDDFIGCYGITSDDTQLQSSTINFDVALHEMLPALMQGGQVEMRGPQLWDIDTTSRHLRDARVTFSRIPTAYWQQWLRTPPPAHELAALRQITVGGEGLPGDALAQWRRGPLAHIRLDNLYGPTETTVACLYRQTNEADTRQSIVSIGEPYASRCVQVLDRFGNEAPVGGLGELCIGGLTLARGYLGRADITAERFVPDPRTPGARMYRSGDLCRRRADGGIDFLGRLDQQVKLRGFRIELGEIEAALRQIEGVSAAIVALTGEGESRQLVGYVVGQDDVRLLRRTLEARLPSYMVPSSFVALDALPLMPNGKVDRAALPAPEAPSHQEHVSARTPLEAELLSIWQSVLNRADIGVTENFFEAGGHSLLLMQVASRIRQEMGREVSLATLFMHPVLESLAAELEASERQTVERIRARAKDSRIPLTHAQERLWFLWNLEPQSAAYTIAGAVRLKGKLNKAAVRTALDTLVTRHESLRTRFVEEDAQTWQVVDEQPRYGWHEAAYEGETQLHALSHAPLDLRQGPMLKVALLAVNEQEAVLHFAMPHIVSDAWSQGILLREFSNAYAAALGHEVTPPEALPIQYGDYAAWQREHTSDATLEAQYAYWQATLGKEHPVLELPVDRVRRGAADSTGAWVHRAIDATLAGRLESLSHARNATRFMTMLAAFGAVLQGYSGQRDVRIGVPVAGRDRLETQALIGFFVNTVVIRVDTAPGTAFDARLAQVRERVLGAHDHATLPFARLVERLQPQRSMSHTPLFQVMFDYSEAGTTLSMPDIEAQALEGGTGTAQFDLSMQISADAQGANLHIGLNYATDIFDEATIDRIIDSYVAVLEQIAEQPSRRSFDLLDATQRASLANWTQGALLAPETGFVHRRFEAHAAARPNDIALMLDEQTLSYGELNARANGVAHWLIAQGVRPDDRIGVAVERSIGMIVALLGVLKAGAAYVPLDPAYPAERLAYMIEDSSIEMLLTQSVLRARLPLPASLKTATLEAIEASASRHDDTLIVPHAQHLAYVIYTSGSTGKPKGVGIAHGAFAQHVDVSIGFFGLTNADRVLQFATFNFDGFVEQLFPALCVGASVVLRGPQLWDSETFIRHVLRDRITVADLTTAYWQLLTQDLQTRGVNDLGALRRVHAGGEAMSLAALRQWRNTPALANVKLLNTYGPTEAAVTASTFDCSAAQDIDALPAQVPIGTPLASRAMHVLTPELTLAPIGVIGEVAIGGAMLARGYLNRPSLTADRFIPDPFDADGRGARLYLTGDLARRNARGELEYVGRIDHQVKIRGFRIELGEIESALRAQALVRDCAAAVREVGGEPMLIGYIVPVNADERIDTRMVRTTLAAKLPIYMVPQRIVVLDALPLSPNGKLDLKALPLPSSDRDAASDIEPGTATELALATIWQKVLGIAHVSADDDFFALGGDSLRTLQVARLAREAGLPPLGIDTLFARPRLADLAAHLDAQGDAVSASVVPMNTAGAPVTAFAIHPAYGLVAEYRTLARSLDGIASIHGLQSPLYDDAHWWAGDLDALARDYAARVRSVQPHGPYRFIGWSLGGLLAVEIAAQLEAAGETVDFVALIDAGMQSEIALDAQRAREVLARRRTASAEEVARFWDEASDAHKQWQAELGEGANDADVVGHALIAIEQLQALTQGWRTRSLHAPLTVWWSERELDGTRLDDATLDRKTALWRACSTNETTHAGTIDTDHVGIVRHEALLRDLAARLKALSGKDGKKGQAHG